MYSLIIIVEKYSNMSNFEAQDSFYLKRIKSTLFSDNITG